MNPITKLVVSDTVASRHPSWWRAGWCRLLPAACFVTLALLLAACGDDSEDEPTTASDTESTVDETADPETEAASESDDGDASSVPEPAETTDEGDPAPAGGSELGPFEAFGDGTYTMDELGVPVSFTVSGQWSTQPVGPGYFVITTPDSLGPGDHDIVAIAPTSLFDATTREPSLAGDDLVGWLDTVPDTATVSEPTTGESSGFATTVFTIDVGETPCAEEDEFLCVDFALVGDEFGKSFDRGFVYEVHWIEHSEGPLAFVIGTPADDLAWLDTAREVTATITFG